MLKHHPNALTPLLRARYKQVMPHLHVALIRLKQLHLRLAPRSVPPKNSVQTDIQLAVCQIDTYALAGAFGEGEEVAG